MTRARYHDVHQINQMVTGCDAFSTLSGLKSSGERHSTDMEALIGDPTNNEMDQEITLILNQQGLDDLHGPNGKQIPQLRYETPQIQPHST